MKNSTDRDQQRADALLFSLVTPPDSIPARDLEDPEPLFNHCKPYPCGSVLTVAGSDSGGGAGIQGDLKTITLLGGYASSVISCLTAQNTLGVHSTYQPPASFFSEQLHAVLSDIPVDVIKTGMLNSAELIAILAKTLDHYPGRIVVIDPVMTAKGGWNLLEKEACATLVSLLLPRCYLITPNIPEAEQLTGLSITDEQGMINAAHALRKLGARNVLLKGGHLEGGTATDILVEGSEVQRFAAKRIHHGNTHGTGCTYASAIATLLAQGEALPRAVSRAKEFVTAAIYYARPLGSGHGPLNHYLAARIFAAGANGQDARSFCRKN
ncbi:MAG: bifunctional hydroxymethylpyrimidine kinase/phosphomethylpyrimidine kinase [Deltaproteobacteria bacterium]|nr:bifunctional hydroxymethylpyrimidine kinase/phosphomethylpyrimidine kinase [Deltaproteobacteria bacterium]TLN04618.1 MAG: bifunctional hydroxymethylpyrimidine kinase/phosphomethylpyrimidine kinase [bacterium]